MDLPKLASFMYRFTKMPLPSVRKSPMFLATRRFNFPCPTQCRASNNISHNTQTIRRQFANFQPSIWSYDYIQSLSSEYKEEVYLVESRVLREEVRMMLCKAENQLDQLELIDVLQRLGVAYHFKNEIRNILDSIYNMNNPKKNDLYATALEFRLLRQHGYHISTDVFHSFQDEMGNFQCQSVDVEGMLSLYEASFHSQEDETILDEARDFTLKFLKEYLKQNEGTNYLSLLIGHALELPLHWRIPRWEAHWFVNGYEKSQNMSPALLQFAILDFNVVQTIYLDELKDASR